MDFLPDYKKAKEHIQKQGVFETYSPAYVVTNENLRELPLFLPKNCENVLTVVGSGDHPLWFSLYGAKNVDTFDISCNAKILMDIKVAALSCLNWHNYKRLLNDFYALNKYAFVWFTETKNVDKIMRLLPKTTSEYLENLRNTRIFRKNLEPKKSKSLPTLREYVKLRKTIKEPYKFYMTDIRNLADCLTKSYDFIHLSNILDYIPVTEHKKVILPLLNYVKPGGKILAHNFQYDIRTGYLNYFGDTANEIANSLNNWRYTRHAAKCLHTNTNIILEDTHILEHVR